MKKFIHLPLFLFGLLSFASNAQQISKDELLFLTPEWKGERFADGRPKVPDAILKRMKLVTLEEAWAVLKGDNFKHQYDDGWQTINPDSVLVGRALTATFMPGRAATGNQGLGEIRVNLSRSKPMGVVVMARQRHGQEKGRP